jgi:hypothetical protein
MCSLRRPSGHALIDIDVVDDDDVVDVGDDHHVACVDRGGPERR